MTEKKSTEAEDIDIKVGDEIPFEDETTYKAQTEEPDVVGDLRYAALPQSVKPLWGIRVDRESPDAHVPFESFREVTKEERASLLRMLKGQSLAPH